MSFVSPVSIVNVMPNTSAPSTPQKMKGVDFGTPTKISKVSQLRKRHLDAAAVSESPLKLAKQVPYGEHELSQLAIQSKLEHGITTGRNVTVVESKSPTSGRVSRALFTTQGPPGSTPHSECMGADFFTDQIQRIYTERMPCHRGCHRKMKFLPPGVEVLYSIDYSKDPGQQRVNEQNFRQLQATYGIRQPKPRKVKKL